MSHSQRKSYREFEAPGMRDVRRAMPPKKQPGHSAVNDPFAGMNAEQVDKEKVRRAAIQSLVYFDAGSPDALPEDNVFRSKAMEHLRGDHFKSPQHSLCPVCLRKKQRDAERAKRYAAAGFTPDGRRLEDGTSITPAKNHRGGERFS